MLNGARCELLNRKLKDDCRKKNKIAANVPHHRSDQRAADSRFCRLKIFFLVLQDAFEEQEATLIQESLTQMQI